jgi:hypothetical protein
LSRGPAGGGGVGVYDGSLNVTNCAKLSGGKPSALTPRMPASPTESAIALVGTPLVSKIARLFTSESTGVTLGVGVGDVDGAAVGGTVVIYGGKTGVSSAAFGPKMSCNATNGGPLPAAASAEMATAPSIEIANGPTAAGKIASVGVLDGLGDTKLPRTSTMCTIAMPRLDPIPPSGMYAAPVTAKFVDGVPGAGESVAVTEGELPPCEHAPNAEAIITRGSAKRSRGTCRRGKVTPCYAVHLRMARLQGSEKPM